MKKVLFIALCLLSTVSFAQSKGDSYTSLKFGFEFGQQKTKIAQGVSESQPTASSLSVAVEYGYFVANNFSIGLALICPYTSTPSAKSNNDWLSSTTLGIGVNPNISYHLQISDNFYYTPEIGGYFEYGKYEDEQPNSISYDTNYKGWGAYLNLLSFEFRVSKDFAMGVNAGALQYVTTKIDDISVSRFGCVFNRGEFHFRAYF